MSKKRHPAMGFIFVTILIDVVGMGIIIPVLPTLIGDLTGSDISAVSRYAGWLTFSYAIMQFVCAPIMGGLSDRFGRRPVLLASLFGFGLDYLLLAFAPTIGWLFVGRLIAGMMGASVTTASAYVADISTPEKQAQNFGLVGAAFGLGFMAGPVLGGVLGQFGHRVPFLTAGGLALLNGLYGLMVLPESLRRENRRVFRWKRANPLSSLRHLGRYPVVSGLIGALVLLSMALQGFHHVWSFFVIAQFRWNEAQIGYSLGFVGLTRALVQGLLIRYTAPRLGARRSVYLGLLMMALGLALFAFATEGWMMYAFFLPYSLSGLAGPSLQGLISSQVPPDEQGELQGALTSLFSLIGLVGPLLMTNLFACFTGPSALAPFPGAPFLVGSLFSLASLVLAARSFTRSATARSAP